ncbi:hypothetical protein J3F83DRAFT_341973 [Trichoderma novae-zelandiae]
MTPGWNRRRMNSQSFSLVEGVFAVVFVVVLMLHSSRVRSTSWSYCVSAGWPRRSFGGPDDAILMPGVNVLMLLAVHHLQHLQGIAFGVVRARQPLTCFMHLRHNHRATILFLPWSPVFHPCLHPPQHQISPITSPARALLPFCNPLQTRHCDRLISCGSPGPSAPLPAGIPRSAC